MADLLREQLQASLGAAYRVERELGGGGMSRVFVAEEMRFHRRVVIKVLPPDLAAELSAERFEREIALAAGLQQANIVPVITAGEVGGLPWYSMPYIEGESLRARLSTGEKTPRALALGEAVHVLADVAKALAHAHERGIVHRDIKPENVLLSGGTAVVTDFGIAKALAASKTHAPGGTLTQIGMSLGTPAYMAPEQAVGDPVDHRADIYAWGVLAYELLAGRHPFAGKTGAQQLIAAHIAEAPVPLRTATGGVSIALAALVMRCLEKSPEKRPQSATELVTALDSVATPSQENALADPARSRRSAIRRAGSVVGIVLLAVGVGWSLRPFVTGRRPPGGLASEAKGVQSIAVLPFTNASQNPEDEYFSDGIAAELITALSVPGLRVMSHSSSFAFKGRHLTGQQIGESLKVASVLEAQVRRSGNQLRLTAQLVNVADGATLWSKSYDREMQDVFAVQDEIARSIANELKVAYAPTTSRLASSGTTDLVAHDLYLKGLFESNRRTPSGIRRGIAYFEQAIARDSTYALAHLGLADAHLISNQFAGVSGILSSHRGERAALKALEIDSSLAEAHATLGSVYAERYRWQEAEEQFKRAIALRPEYARAHHWYVNSLLRPMRRFDSAQAEIRRAVELDPASPAILTNTAINFEAMGEYGRAVEQMKLAVTRFPDSPPLHHFLGSAYALNQQYAEAEAEFRKGNAIVENAHGLELAWLFGLIGKRLEADSIIRAAEARVGAERLPPLQLAYAYVGVGDKDRAFEYLSKAVDSYEGSPIPQSAKLVSLRSDPRYAALLKRMNLEP
jgi:serine/threonine-protein kinase